MFKWYDFDNGKFTQSFYGTYTHTKGCVIREKDGFVTGSIRQGEQSRIKTFDSVESAKSWVEQQVGGDKLCPNCGYKYKE